jgi:hypothetical protein
VTPSIDAVRPSQDRYRRFLERELKSLGIGHYASQSRRDLYKKAIGEVMEALFLEPHEGVTPTYGAILYTGRAAALRDRHGMVRPRVFRSDSPHVRRFADGIRSFHLTASDGTGVLTFDTPLLSELDLFSLRDGFLFDSDHWPSPFEKGCDDELIVVQRSLDGIVSLLVPEGIVLQQHDTWTFRPYQYAVLRAMRVAADLGAEEKAILRSLLRICVHMIGPAPGIGTTIVLLRSPDERGLEAGGDLGSFLNTANALPFPWDTPVHESLPLHHPLVHVMSQHDGATIVGSDGRVRYIRAWLTPPTAALSNRRSQGGTRHLTAQAFSESIKGFVLVSSADGPTTVFHQGKPVVRTADIGAKETRSLLRSR